MKQILFSVILCCVMFVAWHNKLPGKNEPQQPILFAKGIISTEDDEFGATFTPDGNTCYFTLQSPSTITSNIMVICVSNFINGKWNQPEIASFSGKYKDFNPSVSPDGSKLFFISNRPVNEKKKFDTDIWMVEKTADGWSEPKNLGDSINTSGFELGCSVAADGTLYFSTTGISGNLDLYKSIFINGRYQKPQNLGDSINTAASETDPFIAPDQSYIIFSSQGRPDGLVGKGASAEYPRSDLYISLFKNSHWTSPKNLGSPVNSEAEENTPFISGDGKTLFFTSERNFVTTPMNKKLEYDVLENYLHGSANGLGDIYSVPVSSFMDKIK